MKRQTFQEVTLSGLKRYCRSNFDDLRQSLDIQQKVHFLPLVMPFFSMNGFTISVEFKKSNFVIMVVNLWPYRSTKKQSLGMSKFHLFSVVAHELKHIKILQDWRNGVISERGVLFSQWAITHITGRFTPDQLIRQYMMYRGASELRKKRYAVSPVELICYEYGYRASFQRNQELLNEDEMKIVKTILDSMAFINRHIEIDYFSGKQAYNRFAHTMYYMCRTLPRRPERVAKNPQLQVLFTPEGNLKSPIWLFGERTEENAEFIDYVLIRMFITLSFDWSVLFDQNQELYRHICVLANDYCAEAIHYLKNSQIGEVFLNTNVLEDNAAMLIKNVNVLNQLMEKYHIDRTSGSVIPLFYTDDFTRKR